MKLFDNMKDTAKGGAIDNLADAERYLAPYNELPQPTRTFVAWQQLGLFWLALGIGAIAGGIAVFLIPGGALTLFVAGIIISVGAILFRGYAVERARQVEAKLMPVEVEIDGSQD